jgi:hypothetical protein
MFYKLGRLIINNILISINKIISILILILILIMIKIMIIIIKIDKEKVSRIKI